jgi:hypothetical protein
MGCCAQLLNAASYEEIRPHGQYRTLDASLPRRGDLTLRLSGGFGILSPTTPN